MPLFWRQSSQDGGGLPKRLRPPGRQSHEADVQLDIVVPVIMSCALLWWVSRGMSWTTRLTVAAITLAIIIGILLFERSRG